MGGRFWIFYRNLLVKLSIGGESFRGLSANEKEMKSLKGMLVLEMERLLLGLGKEMVAENGCKYEKVLEAGDCRLENI